MVRAFNKITRQHPDKNSSQIFKRNWKTSGSTNDNLETNEGKKNLSDYNLNWYSAIKTAKGRERWNEFCKNMPF